MKQYPLNMTTNIALLGHGGSGKTTLADAILCYGKATERIGKTADGTTVMDFDPEEKKRKVSVSASVYALEINGRKLNIADAPGLFDFAGGVTEALSAADSALIVISGKSGLTSGAKQSFLKARSAGKAAAFFIGKLDSTHAHFYRVISALVGNYGALICPVTVPYIENDEVKCYINLIENKAYSCDGFETKEMRMPVSNETEEMRNMLLEAVATADDALMEKYFAGEEFTPAEIISGLKKGVASGDICPVFCGIQQTGAAVPMTVDILLEIMPTCADSAYLLDDRSEHKFDENGEKIIEGISTFVLVDAIDHRIVKASALGTELPTDSQRKSTLENPKKIHLPKELKQTGSKKVLYSMLDSNEHLNNALYADFLIDFIDSDKVAKIKGFSIDFVKEARLGEKIEVFENKEENEIFFKGDVDNNTCFRGRLKF